MNKDQADERVRVQAMLNSACAWAYEDLASGTHWAWLADEALIEPIVAPIANGLLSSLLPKRTTLANVVAQGLCERHARDFPRRMCLSAGLAIGLAQTWAYEREGKADLVVRVSILRMLDPPVAHRRGSAAAAWIDGALRELFPDLAPPMTVERADLEAGVLAGGAICPLLVKSSLRRSRALAQARQIRAASANGVLDPGEATGAKPRL